jgi:processing peptidase subunit beta
MVTTGKRYTPKEVERYVDAVTPDDIKRVAQKYLWDKDVSALCPSLVEYRH